MKENNYFMHTHQSYTLSTFQTHTQVQRHCVIPALLFCSSHFNWGFGPGSCLSHCDVLKIAPQQVSESLVRLMLKQSFLAQTVMLRAERVVTKPM